MTSIINYITSFLVNKAYKFALLIFISCSAINANAQQLPFDTLQKPQLISKQFSFTEGPAVDKQGNIYFTDQPNDKIWKYDVDGKLSIFLDKAGRANGMYFDSKGNLIVCADEHDELWSINKKGKAKVLMTNYNGHRFNGPNDVWVRNNGDIYFTDPYYQRDYWDRTKSDLDGEKVYYLPKGGAPIVADDQLKKPNGIAGSADGHTLFVADIGAGKTYQYTVAADGKLTNKQLFCNQGSDGMTLDAEGNVYLTGKGVTVYNKSGNKIAHININEPWTANVCFGGKDRKTLFIAASTAIYTLKMNVKGIE